MTGTGGTTRVVIVSAALLVAGCSGGEDDAAGTAPPDVVPATTQQPSAAPASSAPSTSPAPSASTSAPTTVGVPDTAPATSPPGSTAPASTASPADTGVPGLDSDDAFCAAWSRFGGSWQVVIVASAGGSPDEAAQLEVLASTVVGDAYDSMFAVWPDELAVEREVVAEQFFGPFERRSADALASLSEAGADEADIDELGDLWVDALAARSPSDPVLGVDVPGDLARTVADATDAFMGRRTPLVQDPSMVITAQTPLTDAYLTAACPDQGSILGGDAAG